MTAPLDLSGNSDGEVVALARAVGEQLGHKGSQLCWIVWELVDRFEARAMRKEPDTGECGRCGGVIESCGIGRPRKLCTDCSPPRRKVPQSPS